MGAHCIVYSMYYITDWTQAYILQTEISFAGIKIRAWTSNYFYKIMGSKYSSNGVVSMV